LTVLSDLDLREGFDAFIDAARRLEDSYRDLKVRADAMDLQLAQTNRRLEAALDERETLFRALPLGLLVLRDGAVGLANPEAERLQVAAREHGVDLGRAATGDLRFGSVTLRVRREALPNGDSLIVLEDRSRLRHLEQEVHRLDRLAGLSELAMGIAHEVKNPLNGVLGFAQLLQRSSDPLACRRHAERIVSGVEQIDAIVKALLAFSSTGDRAGRTATVGSLVDQAASGAGLARERVTAVGELEECVVADAVLRVLVNLLRNSAEASDDVQVVVTVESRATTVALRIQDNGPGIPAELGPRVFEPFVSSKERGHGLGLALCARVLGYLGGSVALVEHPGDPGGGRAGACFEVVLPRLAEDGAR